MREQDEIFLPLGLRNSYAFHEFSRWYFRGFVPQPWQWGWHYLTVPGTAVDIPNTTLVTGIATGKTSIMAASYMGDCMAYPYFRALSCSITAKQSELAFMMALSWIEGNERLEPLVDNIVQKPFPVIEWKNFSQYEFRTAGLKAKYIRGFEYDRIGYDEAGSDTTDEAVKVLRGRLRGVRKDGRNTPRMARLDVMGSPTAALWFRQRFNRGIETDPTYDPLYASLRVATWDNPHLTKVQIDAMKAEYPPDLIDVEMGGQWPDFGYTFFAIGHVDMCTNFGLYDLAYEALYPEDGQVKPGYDVQEDLRHGIYKFELPAEPGHLYVSGGDPGSGNFPERDTGVVAVLDVTVEPARLVYFHAASGRGSYNPFLLSYKYAIQKYSPVLKGIDATGPQKALDEIGFANVGIQTEKINFTTEKHGILNQLKADISNHQVEYPQIKALVRQLSIYTDEYDRKGGAQDMVMALAICAFLRKFVPSVGEAVRSEQNVYTPRNKRSRRYRE